MFVRDFQERHAVWLARLAVVLALLVSVWWVADMPPPPPVDPAEQEEIYRDRDLYNDVTTAVAGGANYYRAAATLHRENGYPTSPWFTIRLPTQAVVSAWLGAPGSIMLVRGLVIAGALAWMAALFTAKYGPFELFAGGIAALAGGFVVFYDTYFLHELWAGALLSLAFALYSPRRPWAAIALVVCACSIREFSILALGAGLFLSAMERRRGEAFGWLIAAVIVATFYTWHALEVISVRQPGDELSQGWSGFIGPMQAIYAVASNSIYRAPGFEIGGVLLVCSLFGLFALRERAWIAAPVAFAWMAVIAMLSRPENYYWSQLLLPWLPIGLVLFPRLCLTAIMPAKSRQMGAVRS